MLHDKIYIDLNDNPAVFKIKLTITCTIDFFIHLGKIKRLHQPISMAKILLWVRTNGATSSVRFYGFSELPADHTLNFGRYDKATE